jgi:hypothetical protein
MQSAERLQLFLLLRLRITVTQSLPAQLRLQESSTRIFLQILQLKFVQTIAEMKLLLPPRLQQTLRLLQILEH